MLKNLAATPFRHAVLVSTAAILLLLGMRLSAGTVWQGRLLGVIPAVVSLVLFFRLWEGWRASRGIVARWGLRVVKSWRKFAKPAPILAPLHMLSFALGLVSASLILTGWLSEGWLLFNVAGGILAIAGIWDIAVRTSAILRRAWAPAVGKVLAVSLGVSLAAVTLSLAKQMTHSLNNIDPKYMIEFTAAIAGCLLPVVYLMAVAVALSLYAFFQLMLLVVLSAGGNFVMQAKPFVSNEIQGRIRLLWFRIRTGKRPAGGVLPRAAFLSPSVISLVASPLSKLAVLGVLSSVLQAATGALPVATPIMSKLLVEMEYRTSGSCRNIAAGLPILYMDNEKVSVARLQDGKYVFTVEACDYVSVIQ